MNANYEQIYFGVIVILGTMVLFMAGMTINAILQNG